MTQMREERAESDAGEDEPHRGEAAFPGGEIDEQCGRHRAGESDGIEVSAPSGEDQQQGDAGETGAAGDAEDVRGSEIVVYTIFI